MEDSKTDDSLFDNSQDGLDDNLFQEDLSFNDYGMGAQPPMERHSGLLKDLTNFDDIIKDIVNSWLGRVWNQEKSEFVTDPLIKPIMNELCALWCIGFLKTYARKTNIITNITKTEYNELHVDIIRVIWLGLATRDDFGIQNTSDLYRICVELEHAAILVLMGAGDGKYTKFLGESVQRNESVSYTNAAENSRPQMRQGKPGLLAGLKNRLLGRH